MSYAVLVCLTILGWGAGAFLCKIATNNISPMMMSVIMTLLYVALMPFTLWFVKFDKSLNAMGLIFAVLGGAAMALGSMTYFYALQKGPAGATTILCAVYPSLTLLLSGVFLGEGITWKKIVGFIIVMIGSLFVIKK